MSNQPAECAAEYHYDELRSYSQCHRGSVPAFRSRFPIQNDYLHMQSIATIHSHTLGNFNFVAILVPMVIRLQDNIPDL